jgi:hypothetical protein
MMNSKRFSPLSEGLVGGDGKTMTGKNIRIPSLFPHTQLVSEKWPDR